MGVQAWVILAILVTGCTRPSERPTEPAPPIVEVRYECPAYPPCPTASEVLKLKDEAFQSLNIREEEIQKLRAEISKLENEVKSAEMEISEWQDRFYDREQ